MAKVFSFDARTGSLTDKVAGITGVNTSPLPSLVGNKGRYFSTTGVQGQNISFGTNVCFSFPNNIMSFDCCIRIPKKQVFGVAGGTIIGTGQIGALGGFRLTVDSKLVNALRFGIAANGGALINITAGQWIHIIGTADGINTYAYLNGTYTGSFAIAGSAAQTRPFTIGSDPFADRCGAVDIAWVNIYNHVLTEAERAKALADFNSSYPVIQEKLPQQSIINKPMDLSNLKNTGLVAAYNMIPQGNTLVDISGNGRNGTLSRIVSTSEGIKFQKLINPNWTYYSGAILSTSGMGMRTICFRIKNLLSDGGYFFELGGSHRIGNAFGNVISFTGSLVGATCYINGINTTSLSVNKWNNVVIISSANISITNSSMVNLANGNASGIFELADLRFYNRALSEAEIKNYHNSFVTPTLIEDFSSEGADGIAKVPTGWVKQSGAFKVGEWISKSGNIVSNGGFDTDTVWNKSAQSYISNGRGHVVSSDGSTQYLSQLGVLTVGKRYKLTFDCIANLGGVYIGDGSGILVAGFNESKTYTVQFTATLTTNLYFMRAAVCDVEIDNVIVEEISPIPTFKPGTKYLECVTAGVLAIPSKQAYGTWEFDWYKGNDANVLDVQFIATKLWVGYNCRFAVTEAIYFQRTGSSNLFYTANSIMTLNSWYRIKIIRTISGVFTVLAKGGSLVPTTGHDGWTLISVTGGFGTNPATDNTITTSEYFVLDIDAGDRIANIKLLDGIEEL